ncbi:MAG TPA: hypothetical protein VMS22_11715 [Candidatus Eisenbacteria bacterium]|nr:hypothetical protein [Candidatus Eisenbacteria bacterium]
MTDSQLSRATVIRTVVVYVIVFAILGWPWLRMASAGLPADDAPADAWLIVWVLEWVSHALGTAPTALFDPPINYPAAKQLAGSEHFLSSQLLFAPLKLVTGNPLLAANLTAFLCYPLAAAAMSLFLQAVGLSSGVAFVGGLFYGFGAAGTPGRLHILQSQHLYLPLVALMLHRLRARPGRQRALLLGGVFLAGLLSSYHMAVYLSAMGLTWSLAEYLAPLPQRRAYVGWGAAASIAALGVLVAISRPYLARPEVGGDPEVLLSRYSTTHLDAAVPEEHAAIVSPSDLVRHLAICLVTAAGPFCKLAASGALNWEGLWLAARIYSYNALAAILATIALVAAARGTPYRAIVSGALLVALAGLLLSGPEYCRFGGVDVALPRKWLTHTPARFIRAPQRANVLPLFGGTVLMTVGLAVALPRRRVPRALLIAMLAGLRALVVFEPRLMATGGLTAGFVGALSSRFAPTQFLTTPTLAEDRSVYDAIAGAVENDSGPLVEWPESVDRSSSVMGQMIHRQPSIDFYTGYQPVHVTVIRHLLALLPDAGALDDLVDMTGLRWILVRPVPADRTAPREKLLAGLRLHRRFRGETVLGGFTLVEIDPSRGHPGWFEAIAAGSQPGRTVLGTPIAPLPDRPNQVQVHVPSPGPIWIGSRFPLTVLVRNLGDATWPAAVPGRGGRRFTVRLEATWGAGDDSTDGLSEAVTHDLRRDLGPREMLAETLILRAPPHPGRYRLEVALRQVAGADLACPSNPARLEVEVVPRGATPPPVGTPPPRASP